jgi:hypothetical protein
MTSAAAHGCRARFQDAFRRRLDLPDAARALPKSLDHPDVRFEVKHDGFRVLAIVEGPSGAKLSSVVNGIPEPERVTSSCGRQTLLTGIHCIDITRATP